MSSEQFHMDEWLQRSAAQGDIPVHEQDWQQMKDLLQPRKKRRFFFWWFILLIFLGAGGWLMLRQANKTKQPVITASQKENHISNSSSVNNTNSPVNTDRTNITKEDTVEDHHNETVAVKERLSNNDIPIVDRGNSNSTSLITQNPVKGKTGSGVLVAENKKEHSLQTAVDGNRFKSGRNKKAGLNKKGNHSIEVLPGDTGEQDSVNDKQLSLNPARDIASLLFTEKAAMTRPFPDTVQSSNKLTFIKDPSSSINKKNKKTGSTDKGYWFTELGFVKGNMPVSGQSFGLYAGRSFSLGKHFSFNAGAGISLLNGGEPQSHKQVTAITRIPGTTFYFVDTRETKYKTGNGKLISTNAAFTYKNKNWEISTGAGYGSLLSSKNTNSSFYDTATSYPSQPQGMTVSSAYDPSQFNGKQFISLNFELKYRVFKKYYTGIGLGKEMWRQTFEGIADENKKRFSFRLFTGIRF